MNEFTSKKLGEVLAFSQVGTETMEKARKAYESIFGAELETILNENSRHGESIEAIAAEHSVAETVHKKLDGTGTKLRKMREIYLASPEDWENPSEILEWMGFFEGAAFIHWKLVRGAAEASGNESLAKLAEEASNFHDRLISEAASKLMHVGQERGV